MTLERSNEVRLVIWHVEDDEWEVLEMPTGNTVMLSTLDACRYEYPEAIVE